MKEVIDASEEEKKELQGALNRMTEANAKARQDMKGVEGGMQAKCDELVQKYRSIAEEVTHKANEDRRKMQVRERDATQRGDTHVYTDK